MKYSNDELQQAYDNLHNTQNIVKTVFGACIGLFFSAWIYYFFGVMQGILVIFLAIPPILIGFFAKLTGQPFKILPRVLVAIIALITHILGCYYLQLNPLFYLFAPVAASIAFITSKIKLSRVENIALDMAEIGKIKTVNNH